MKSYSMGSSLLSSLSLPLRISLVFDVSGLFLCFLSFIFTFFQINLWVIFIIFIFHFKYWIKSSVIRRKGKYQNGCFKKQCTTNFPKNEHFLPPDTHTYMCVSAGGGRGKKCSFFGKFGVPFEIRPFALLPTKFYCCQTNKTTVRVLLGRIFGVKICAYFTIIGF